MTDSNAIGPTGEARNPLEAFLCHYLEAAGGAWEQVEPQVYDLMPPEPIEPHPDASDALTNGDSIIQRVTFDPEARVDHPQSHLLTLGTPLMDHLLADARTRGRYAQAHVVGLNLHPFDLHRRLRRTLQPPEGVSVTVDGADPVSVTIGVYWFTATYESDQKEQDLLPVAVDRYHGRLVRHLNTLLSPQTLDEYAVDAPPQADHVPPLKAYAIARQRVVRTISATANQRKRELMSRISSQQARMRRYYSDLLEEIAEQHARARQRADEAGMQRGATRQRQAEQERDVRLAELARKASLQVQLRLAHLLCVHHPKLEVAARLAAKDTTVPLRLLWDPLIEAFEPPACPGCGRPTLQPRPAPQQHAWRCPDCRP